MRVRSRFLVGAGLAVTLGSASSALAEGQGFNFANVPVHARGEGAGARAGMPLYLVNRPVAVRLPARQTPEQSPTPVTTGPVLLSPKPQVARCEKPWANFCTWVTTVTETRIAPRRVDPWEGSLGGFKRGDRLRIETQEKSAVLELPGVCGENGRLEVLPWRLEGVDAGALRRAVTSALRFVPFREILDAPVPEPVFDAFGQVGHTAPLKLAGPETLAVHTPVRVSAVCTVGGSRRVAYANAQGKRTEWSSTEKQIQMPLPGGGYERGYTRVITETVHSGRQQRHYQPWVVDGNVFATPAYQAATGERQADLLFLAALPIGARVSVTNVDMEGRWMAGHTLTTRVKSGTGSLKLAIPAPEAGATYRLAVHFPGSLDASNTTRLTHTFQLPGASDSRVQQHGLAYYRLGLGMGQLETLEVRP
ncbi:MAG: hypothetical protein IT371_11805 [Deltaproteobacteria bacterium]|nr:hypothetical protein [Deltaproteobacteria bacterium]